MTPTNPRYRLFCKAHGWNPDDDTPRVVKERTRRFPAWLAQQRQTFRDATGADAIDAPAWFNEWLESRYDA